MTGRGVLQGCHWFEQVQSLGGPYLRFLLPVAVVAIAVDLKRRYLAQSPQNFEVKAAQRYLIVQAVLQGQPPLAKMRPEVGPAFHCLVVQLVLEWVPLAKVSPGVEAARRHSTVQPVLQGRPRMAKVVPEAGTVLRCSTVQRVPPVLARVQLSKVWPEVEAGRRYLIVQRGMQGRPPPSKRRSALQADWPGSGLEMPRAALRAGLQRWK